MSEIHDIIRSQIKEPLWDNWYIKEKIGVGATGEVYRIEAKRENRTDVSALKIEPITADENVYIDDSKRREYLEKKRKDAENETTIMYKLRSSPNIVLYEDEAIKPLVHEGKEIGYYMLIRMEYLTCVQQIMKERKFDLSIKNVLKLAADIGSGIKAAHDLGVIHRDIKPGNFFVSANGTYKLGDFNISTKSVSTRSFAGTEGFIAPEVYNARYGSNGYTKSADIYSFGIALYCIMNDYQFPFGDVCIPEEAIDRRLNGEALPKPKRASDEFAAIILKACAFNVSDRYQSMSDMLNDLNILRLRLNGGGNQAVFENNAFAGSSATISAAAPVQNQSVYNNQNNYGAGNVYQNPVNNYGGMSQQRVSQVNVNRQGQMSQYNNNSGNMYVPPNNNPNFPPNYNNYNRSPVPRKKSSAALKIILGICLAVLMIVLGVLVFFIVQKNNEKVDSSDASSSEVITTDTPEEPKTTAPEEEETTVTTAATTARTTAPVTNAPAKPVSVYSDTFALEVGDTDFVMIKEYPDGSDENDEIWRSADTSVAEVDSHGRITAIGLGECYIILTFKNNPASEARIYVKVSAPAYPVQNDSSAVGSSNTVNGSYAVMDGDFMFYSDSDSIYSVKNNMSTKIYDTSAYYMNAVGDYIYFCDANANNAVCRIKKDGSDYTVVYPSYCYEMTFYDGWLYFSDMTDSGNYLCRMKPDGSNYTKLHVGVSWYMNIYSGKIYFINFDNGMSLDVINVDGSGYKMLLPGSVSDLCVSDGRIYYSADRDSRYLYSMKMDGTDNVLINDNYTRYTNVCGNKVYCTDKDNHLVVIDLTKNKGTVYENLGYVSYPVIVGTIMYCEDKDGSVKIYDLGNSKVSSVDLRGQINTHGEVVAGFATSYVCEGGASSVVRRSLENGWHITAKNTCYSYGVTWYELWDTQDGDYYGWVDSNYIDFY